MSDDDAKVPTVQEQQEPPVKHVIVYRPDIDGLRMLAVVPVILFHAYPESFPSGFIGVDIFFVISGYLISSILFKETAKGTFTYANFYSRRIRRIYPTSRDHNVCWHHANIQVMLLERGYFDDDIKENPLLHLWSLGVEEQFYIFWPLFVAILTRLPVRSALIAQVVVLTCSFGFNIALLGFRGTNKYSFYFPLCRFWQMGVGGLLAYFNYFKPLDPQYSILSSSELAQEKASSFVLGPSSTSWFDLSLIVLGFACLDEMSAFPGFWALLPTLGAALLIFAGPAAWFNQQVLSHPWAVYIGKISYALYLWHWPLLVFAKLRYPNPDFRPNYMSPFMMLVLAFALSLSSVHHVEDALRRHKSKWVVPGLLCGMLAMTVLSAAVMTTPESFSYAQQALTKRGSPVAAPSQSTNPGLALQVEEPNVSRLGHSINPTLTSIDAALHDWHPNDGLLPMPHNHSMGDGDDRLILNPGHEGKALVVALGDMHMEMLKPRFIRLSENTKPKDFPTIVFKYMAHPPLVSCAWWTDLVQVKIKQVHPRAVVYGINWLQYFRPGQLTSDTLHKNPGCCTSYDDACLGQSRKDVQVILSRFGDDLASMTLLGIKVFVNTISPEGSSYDPKNMVNGVAAMNRSAFRDDHAWLIQQIEHTITAASATVYDISDNLCWEEECQVVDSKGIPIRKDSNVLTSTFAAEYLTVIDHVIEAAMNTTEEEEVPLEAPNSSRGPRIEEPTLEKIVAAGGAWWPDSGYEQLPKNSTYGSPVGTWRYSDSALNLGQKRLIVGVGDSHSSQVKPRFLKLYRRRHAASNPSIFPTIVFKSKDETPLLPCREVYDNILDMIKRSCMVYWPQYLRPGGKDSDERTGEPLCCWPRYHDKCEYQRPKDVRAIMNQLQKDLAELVALGIKVFVATFNAEGRQFDPKNMLNGDDVGDVRPVFKSKFREEHQELFGLIEAAVAGANATLIDFSDNYCWEDVCQVLDHRGRPIMKDTNHVTSTYAYEYLSVADQIIDAAMSD
ncbi:unnamed protein product [Aphanomyces euteiches]